MHSNIFIPKTIRVGFQERNDTYTKRLAYVIYYDAKGKLRKETSWKSWCTEYITEKEAQKLLDEYNKNVVPGNTFYKKADNFDDIPSYYKRNKSRNPNINPQDFKNEPIEGFVLNKNAGGVENSWSSWNPKLSYYRVYDPRGFEFEITIPNLFYILQNANCTKGKGLEGKFIYGWDGKELVLIPEDAPEYKQMLEFTELQKKSVKSSELVVGNLYKFRDGKECTYMGKHIERTEWKYKSNNWIRLYEKPRFVFYNNGGFYGYSNPSNAAKDLGPNSNYADIQEKFQKDPNFSDDLSEFKFERTSLTDKEDLICLCKDGKYRIGRTFYTRNYFYFDLKEYDELDHIVLGKSKRSTVARLDKSEVIKIYKLIFF